MSRDASPCAGTRVWTRVMGACSSDCVMGLCTPLYGCVVGAGEDRGIITRSNT